MTDDAYREIVALRARLAELERMAATMTKGDPMYRNDEPTDQDKIQLRLRAESWTFDPQLEQVVERLDKDPDNPALAGSLRMQAAFYKQGREAARRAGRRVDGLEVLRLDTTGDRS